MARFQYPALQAPPGQPPAQPAEGWQAQPSEPPPRRWPAALFAAALFPPVGLPPAPPAVPPMGWLQALNEPAAKPFGGDSAKTVLGAASGSIWTPQPFTQAVVTPPPPFGWYAALAEPSKRAASAQGEALALAFAPRGQISLAWAQPLSEPLRGLRRDFGDSLVLALRAPASAASATSPTGWLAALAEPYRHRGAPIEGGPAQLVRVPQPPPAVPPMGWLAALHEPAPPPRRVWWAPDLWAPRPIASSAITPVCDPLFIAAGRQPRLIATGRRPDLAATGWARLIATGRIGMKANDLSPPIAALVETRPVTFDFGLQLAAGVTITGATLTALVHSGAADASPASRWQGALAIVASPATGAASQAVVQQFGLVPGATVYTLQCVATCSDGSSPTLETTIQSYVPA